MCQLICDDNYVPIGDMNVLMNYIHVSLDGMYVPS